MSTNVILVIISAAFTALAWSGAYSVRRNRRHLAAQAESMDELRADISTRLTAWREFRTRLYDYAAVVAYDGHDKPVASARHTCGWHHPVPADDGYLLELIEASMTHQRECTGAQPR